MVRAMDDFVLLAYKQSENVSQLILISKRHISKVRPLGNPMSDSALVVMSNGREIETMLTFYRLVEELRG